MSNVKTSHKPSTDDRLLAMESEYRRLEASRSDDQDYLDRLSEQACEIRRGIAGFPAQGPAGMAVKVRILLDSARGDGADWDEPICESLLADLSNLDG
jgi:hypothetical protein